jgi:hypothetical protein
MQPKIKPITRIEKKSVKSEERRKLKPRDFTDFHQMKNNNLSVLGGKARKTLNLFSVYSVFSVVNLFSRVNLVVK